MLTAYQRYIALSRYARFLPEENRRETWEETVGRYCKFFSERYKSFPSDQVYKAIVDMEVMPSMRALMTAGKALERDNVAGFNCSYIAVDDARAFDEALFILMCGTGLGFSVERQYVNKLPEIAETFHATETTIKVKDSKLGWATALRELISLLYSGKVPQWDLSALRAAGAPLKTFGGRSSGPGPLNELFVFAVNTFRRAAGRRLNSLECHDLMCKIADVVVVGGVRRSALISLSNLSDDRIRNAKMGQWWIEEPQRALSNNSVAYTEKPEIGAFIKEWLALYESKSGERGMFNRVSAKKKIKNLGDRRKVDYDFGTNPCGEILLRPQGFCNLTEVIIREDDTLETLKAKVELATILGTFQSTLTDFRYLRSVWKKNAEEERLLGVSLTGIMDHPILSTVNDTAKEWFVALREHSVKVNKKWADMLGINQAAAITTVKPSGCTTLETQVKTDQGVMSMAEIFAKLSNENLFEQLPGTWLIPNENLYVFDENNEKQLITKLFINGIAGVYELEDDQGNKYKFTGNHQLKTTKGWKRVDQLTIDDEIIEFSNFAGTKISNIKKLDKPELTVDIEVENTHSYQLDNGWVSHNTVSQLVDSSSGIHPRLSRYYIRTVRNDKKDPLSDFLIAAGVPHETDVMKDSNWVFSFPMKSPEHCRIASEMTAIDQLEHYLQVNKYYAEHNPSITVYVREHEWLQVGTWVYDHFDEINGVSFLPYSDSVYQQAPYQPISEEKYNELVKAFPVVDFSQYNVNEHQDNTVGVQTLACVGGVCEV